jgi:hypothetical protein
MTSDRNTSELSKCITRLFLFVSIALVYFLVGPLATHAASLGFSPNTGVYTVNNTFTVRVVVNTDSKPINAADATISFNPRDLSVVSVNRSSSIFNLWVTEPTFSNSAGTISFSGGLPSGYTGSAGTIMSVTFKAVTAGTGRVSFKNGSVLANDGRGTNILTAMNGASYTIGAPSTTPEPEVVEYVAPANTPAAPQVTSTTHPDPTHWYQAKEAVLSWNIPAGVTGVRTLLDESSVTVPTKFYDEPIDTITLGNLPEGISYFHLQYQNEDGWGKITHYRLAVDSLKPSTIDIKLVTEDLTSPDQALQVIVEDAGSPVNQFKIKIDSNEPIDIMRESATSTIPLPALEPGYHTVFVEAFDAAENSIIGTYSFTIEAFDRPQFTEYPNEMSEGVIPVIKGQTRANSTVQVTMTKLGTDPQVYTMEASDTGEFVFIPEGRLAMGVYELTAQATDTHGAQSKVSETIRIAVQQPGIIRIGSFLVSALSVLIPLIVLLALCVLGVWYLILKARRFKRVVGVETTEALEILRREFTELQSALGYHEQVLLESRKAKQLTKAEAAMIEAVGAALKKSQQNVEKEIKDITELPIRKN